MSDEARKGFGIGNKAATPMLTLVGIDADICGVPGQEKGSTTIRARYKER